MKFRRRLSSRNLNIFITKKVKSKYATAFLRFPRFGVSKTSLALADVSFWQLKVNYLPWIHIKIDVMLHQGSYFRDFLFVFIVVPFW